MHFFYSTRITQKLDRVSALKERPFGIFQHFCRKTSKNEGGPLELVKNFRQKVLQCQKTLKGRPIGLTPYCMLRGKKGETFLVQFSRPHGSI